MVRTNLGTIAAILAMAMGQMGSAQVSRHRHHRLAKVAGGIAAYELAKKTGKNRVAHGRKRNFFQKHPVVSGLVGAHVAGKIAKRRHHRRGG